MTNPEDTDQPAESTAETTDTARDAVITSHSDKPTVEQLEAAIRTLRSRDREIFLAHRLDHLSYRQIAEITGLSMKQIEKLMARATGNLHRVLRGEVPRRRRWWPF